MILAIKFLERMMVKIKVFITEGTTHKDPPDAGLVSGRIVTLSRVPAIGEKLCGLSDTETMGEFSPDCEVIEVAHVDNYKDGDIAARVNVKSLPAS